VDVAVDHIAVRVLRLDAPEGIPGADVAPAGVEAHDHRVGDSFHHCVVDRVGRTLGERRAIHAHERAVAPALSVRALARPQNFRTEASDRVDPERGTHRENAGIPQVLAGSEILLRLSGVGFFYESFDVIGFGADVPIPGLSRRRRYAEGDDAAFGGERRTALHRAPKSFALGDKMIRRHREQHRVVGGDGVHRRERQRRRGAAAARLEKNRARPHAGAAHGRR
jgi:hypothetical protein